jgi:hypothetical protein
MQILLMVLNGIGSIVVGAVIAFALLLFESLLHIPAFSLASGCLIALMILMLAVVPLLLSSDKWRRKNWELPFLGSAAIFVIGFSLSISINYMTTSGGADIQGEDVATVSLMLTAAAWPFMFFRPTFIPGSIVVFIVGLGTAAIALDLASQKHFLFSGAAGYLANQQFWFVCLIGLSIALSAVINASLLRRA